MLFEEFFKKKKISLDALQLGDPGLFLEFREHFEQMGEKSFDHTKKYWFNKLRHVYPLPPEVKAEKIRPENPMAEQTVTNTLTEPGPREDSANSVGFKPRFKAATAPKPQPQEKAAEQTPAPAATQPEGSTSEQLAAKPAYKPRFTPKTVTAKAGGSKLTEPTAADEDKPAEAATPPETENTGEEPASVPKMGFKPRFKAGLTNKPVTTDTSTERTATPGEPSKATTASEAQPAQSTNTTENTAAENTVTENDGTSPAPKLGFQPRFKAGVTTTKPAATEPPEPATETTPEVQQAPQHEPTSTDDTHAPATEQQQQAPVTDPAAAKPAYKPRFNPKMVKPKPPQQDE